ncbi:YaiI/YqxD family protein [Novisyntrophococcus fermenticellae]|uniref:YaiI/YqxD family protein n=1 Tax=Novisyntrophococcus fermenticellae TaxID=2068655 RepID=UPI001E4F1F5F|nr:YaiI/YqxD family protein [Novisyntrophococcus fermenticellae]
MQILVDADACPVIAIVERIARELSISVTLLCDTNHVLTSDYSKIKIIGAGPDAVDFALVGMCQKNDIVVTQDYGVAAMILGKGAYGIHQNGEWYTNENIDQMLMKRHIAKKARRAKTKHHIKGPGKRTEADDRRFEESLRDLLWRMKNDYNNNTIN